MSARRPKVVRMPPRAEAAPSEIDELRARVRELEQELRHSRGDEAAGEGLIVALARAFTELGRGVDWDTLAGLWSAAYFTSHSAEVDEFGCGMCV